MLDWLKKRLSPAAATQANTPEWQAVFRQALAHYPAHVPPHRGWGRQLTPASKHFTYNTPALIIMGVIITCVAYGSVMSTTPSIVADYFGLKAYGGNYGIVHTGWGLSLVIGPTISSFSKKLNGNYDFAYQTAIVLVLISLVIVYFLKKPKFRQEDVIDDFILAPEDTKQ